MVRLFFVVWLCVPTWTLSGAATVEGTVPLPKAASDPALLARYKARNIKVETADAPVAVIYLEGQFPAITNTAHTATGTNGARAVMHQKGLQFSPGVLVIRKGTPVEFPNNDNEPHAVISYSKAKRVDLGRYSKDQPAPVVVFDKPGVIDLNCDVHEHMRGTIVVLDTPYFVKSDASGRFSLTNLPAGSHTLRAWVYTKSYSRQVDLKEGETVRVDFGK